MILKTVWELGQRIHERRRDLGWTQSELARRAGTTRQWISQLEKGKATLELGLVIDTVRALGLVVDVREPRKTPLYRALSSGERWLETGPPSSRDKARE